MTRKREEGKMAAHGHVWLNVFEGSHPIFPLLFPYLKRKIEHLRAKIWTSFVQLTINYLDYKEKRKLFFPQYESDLLKCHSKNLWKDRAFQALLSRKTDMLCYKVSVNLIFLFKFECFINFFLKKKNYCKIEIEKINYFS